MGWKRISNGGNRVDHFHKWEKAGEEVTGYLRGFFTTKHAQYGEQQAAIVEVVEGPDRGLKIGLGISKGLEPLLEVKSGTGLKIAFLGLVPLDGGNSFKDFDILMFDAQYANNDPPPDIQAAASPPSNRPEPAPEPFTATDEDVPF